MVIQLGDGLSWSDGLCAAVIGATVDEMGVLVGAACEPESVAELTPLAELTTLGCGVDLNSAGVLPWEMFGR